MVAIKERELPAADVVKEKSTLPPDPQQVRLLVEKAVLGDPESFGELYGCYYQRIYKQVYYRTGNEEVAEDLAAQVFLNAYQAIGKYRDMGKPFVVWLLSITHNLLVDHYKARRDEVYLTDQPGDREVSVTAGRESDPEHFVKRVFESADLRRAINSLRRDQQIVVVCKLVEGMEHSEIAPILGKSEGATRVILHRALGELREMLKEEGNGRSEIERKEELKERIDKYVELHQKKTWMLVDAARATGRQTLWVSVLPSGMAELVEPYRVVDKWGRSKFELPLDVFVRVCEELGPITRRPKRSKKGI